MIMGTLTPAQLTRAQLSAEITLNTGETLTAVPLVDGWKYVLAYDGICRDVCYAGRGIDAAIEAINAGDLE